MRNAVFTHTNFFSRNNFVSNGADYRTEVAAQFPAQFAQYPTAPSTLSSASITVTGCTLNWLAASDNVAIMSYRIFKNGIYHSQVAGNVLTKAITGLVASTAYKFTVLAVDIDENLSPASNQITVTTTA